MTILTDEQRSNCEKLATYLESLPEDYKHFGMRSFIQPRNYTTEYECTVALIEYAKHNGGVHTCATAACAAGHGPAAGILFRDDEFREEGVYEWDSGRTIIVLLPNWSRYCERFTSGVRERAWIFSGSWTYIDDHHWGAAARIRYMLEHGIHYDFCLGAMEYLELYKPYDKRYQTNEA